MSRFGSMTGGFAGLSMFGRPGTSGTVGYFGQKLWAADTSDGWYYNSPGEDEADYTYNTTWVVPYGVTSISIVCIGAGGACCNQDIYVISSGGGGGGLAYENNVSVTPGETLYIRYGRGRRVTGSTCYGATSMVLRPYSGGGFTILCGASGGGNGTSPTSAPNLTSVPGVGGRAYVTGTIWNGYTTTGIAKRNGAGVTATGGYGQGGQGGSGRNGNYPGGTQAMNGGGGAGGYGGNGGLGSGYYAIAQAGVNGGGGGGGKGTNSFTLGAAGGGTTPYGNLGNGAAGTDGTSPTMGGGGYTTYVGTLHKGANYGGGGGGVRSADLNATGGLNTSNAGSGGGGCVRIIWPGTSRQFPSTGTADV